MLVTWEDDATPFNSSATTLQTLSGNKEGWRKQENEEVVWEEKGEGIPILMSINVVLYRICFLLIFPFFEFPPDLILQGTKKRVSDIVIG